MKTNQVTRHRRPLDETALIEKLGPHWDALRQRCGEENRAAERRLAALSGGNRGRRRKTRRTQ